MSHPVLPTSIHSFIKVAWFAASRLLQGVEVNDWDYGGTPKVNLMGSVGMAARFEVHLVSNMSNKMAYKFPIESWSGLETTVSILLKMLILTLVVDNP